MVRRYGDTSGLGRGFRCTSGQGLDGRGFDGSSGLMVGQCDCNTRLLQKSSSLVNSKGTAPLRDSPVSSFPCALGCSAAPASSSHSATALVSWQPRGISQRYIGQGSRQRALMKSQFCNSDKVGEFTRENAIQMYEQFLDCSPDLNR